VKNKIWRTWGDNVTKPILQTIKMLRLVWESSQLTHMWFTSQYSWTYLTTKRAITSAPKVDSILNSPNYSVCQATLHHLLQHNKSHYIYIFSHMYAERLEWLTPVCLMWRSSTLLTTSHISIDTTCHSIYCNYKFSILTFVPVCNHTEDTVHENSRTLP
jgi:hypothetical protein